MASSDSIHRVLIHARRFLARVRDPDPDRAELDALWDYFDSSCATCGRRLVRGMRECRLALADPAGGHAIGNRILICAICAAKREKGMWWRVLVRRCTRDPATYKARTAQIDEWRLRHPPPDPPSSPRIVASIETAEFALANFADACADLRKACRIYWRQDASPSTGTARVGGSRQDARRAAHHRVRPRSNPC